MINSYCYSFVLLVTDTIYDISFPGDILSISFKTEFPGKGVDIATGFLSLFTSECEIEKASLSSSLASHLDPLTWSHYLSRPTNNAGNAVRGRNALIINRWYFIIYSLTYILMHIDDILTVSGTT